MELLLKADNKTIEFIRGGAVLNVNDDLVHRFIVSVELPLLSSEELYISLDNGTNHTQKVLLLKSDESYAVDVPKEVIAIGGIWQFQIIRRRYNSDRSAYTETSSYEEYMAVGDGVKTSDGSHVTAAVLQTLWENAVKAAELTEEAKNSASASEAAALTYKTEAEEARDAAQASAAAAAEYASESRQSEGGAYAYCTQAQSFAEVSVSNAKSAEVSAKTAQTHAETSRQAANDAENSRSVAAESAESANDAKKEVEAYAATIEEKARSIAREEIAKYDFIKPVPELPEVGLPNHIYLVPKTESETDNLFEMWLWVNKGTEEEPDYKWEFEGVKKVEIDLSGLVKNLNTANRLYGTNSRGGNRGYEVGTENKAGSIPMRNEYGAIQTATPKGPIDAANKDYVDNLPDYLTLTDEKKARALAWLGIKLDQWGISAGSVPLRTGAGQIRVGDPTNERDAVSKGYVDLLIADTIDKSTEQTITGLKVFKNPVDDDYGALRVQNDAGEYLYYNRTGLFDGTHKLNYPVDSLGGILGGTIARVEDVQKLVDAVLSFKETYHRAYRFVVYDWQVTAVLYTFYQQAGIALTQKKKVVFYIENTNSLTATANEISAGLLGMVAWKYNFATLNFLDFINAYNTAITNHETGEWLLSNDSRKEFNDFQIPASNLIANNYIKSPYVSEVGFGLEITVPSKTKIQNLNLSNIRAEFICYI